MQFTVEASLGFGTGSPVRPTITLRASRNGVSMEDEVRVHRDDDPDNGQNDNNGGVDDGDGSQLLTDRDSFKFTRDTLIIGFAGHSQSLSEHGRIWDIDPNAGVYQIGTTLKERGYMITLFPEDPKNHGDLEYVNRVYCGDGVIGTLLDNEQRSGGALRFLTRAVNGTWPGQVKPIRKIAMFGYSHGGGSAQMLADFIERFRTGQAIDEALGIPEQDPAVWNAVEFLWSGYIDAVDVDFEDGDAEGNLDSEDQIPTNTQAFFNVYQESPGVLPDGERIVEVLGWPNFLQIPAEEDNRWIDPTHSSIDGHAMTKELLIDHLDNYVLLQ